MATKEQTEKTNKQETETGRKTTERIFQAKHRWDC